ncbi:hypothetical protein ACLOJK_029899 [Asimina triloba]
MSQKKVERNVFIHYNVRLRLKNMKRARNQGQLPDYCPINLDYIFAEDDPLLPWLENREKEIEAVNSEEENYPTPNLNVGRQTSQQGRQEPIIEVEEGSTSSSATHTDHENGSESGDDDSGSGPQPWSGVGGTSETVVPSTYPYPYASQSQAPPSTSRDREKNSIIEEEEEEGDPPIMDSFEGRSSWLSCNPNIYTELPLYPQIPHYPQVPLPQAPQPGIDTYDYLFGYPPQSGYGYGQYMSNTSNDDDNVEEPPRHSFW